MLKAIDSSHDKTWIKHEAQELKIPSLSQYGLKLGPAAACMVGARPSGGASTGHFGCIS